MAVSEMKTMKMMEYFRQAETNTHITSKKDNTRQRTWTKESRQTQEIKHRNHENRNYISKS